MKKKSNNKEKVSRLQVVDPVLLTNILRRVDENVKRQSISNILYQSGLNEIINDYDRYLKLPSDSGLKDTFRMNLLSRVANFKSKGLNREWLLSNVNRSSGNGTNEHSSKCGLETKSVRFKKCFRG